MTGPGDAESRTTPVCISITPTYPPTRAHTHPDTPGVVGLAPASPQSIPFLATPEGAPEESVWLNLCTEV